VEAQAEPARVLAIALTDVDLCKAVPEFSRSGSAN
jgi:hypothetical protein